MVAVVTWHGAHPDHQALHHGVQSESRAQDSHATGDVIPHLILRPQVTMSQYNIDSQASNTPFYCCWNSKRFWLLEMDSEKWELTVN